MRKGIKLKAIFSDEEKSLKRFRNYEIEDLGQDGTVYVKNDRRKLLSFPPDEVYKTFNIEKHDRRILGNGENKKFFSQYFKIKRWQKLFCITQKQTKQYKGQNNDYYYKIPM